MPIQPTNVSRVNYPCSLTRVRYPIPQGGSIRFRQGSHPGMTSRTIQQQVRKAVNAYKARKAILSHNIFRIPPGGIPIDSGTFTVHGFDGPSVIVKRKGETIAGAYLDSDTVDGVRDLEFFDQYGHATKRKCVALIQEWIEKNRQTVYPQSARINQQ